MLRKLAATLIICLSFNTMATNHIPASVKLKNAFSELNFALEVEWDQQDGKYFEAQVNKFSKIVEQLQDEGLTNAEMVEFVKQSVVDQKLAKNLDGLLETIEVQNMTDREARDFALEYVRNFYSSGASWIGDPIYWISPAITIAFIILIVAVGSGDNDNTNTDVDPGDVTCFNDYVCDYFFTWDGDWVWGCNWIYRCY